MSVYKDNDQSCSKNNTYIVKVHEDAIADFVNSLNKDRKVNDIIINKDCNLFLVRYTIKEQ